MYKRMKITHRLRNNNCAIAVLHRVDSSCSDAYACGAACDYKSIYIFFLQQSIKILMEITF